MSRAKLHTYWEAYPLSGDRAHGRCGTPVLHPASIPLTEWDSIDAAVNDSRMCHKCRKIGVTAAIVEGLNTYFHVIVNAQEAKLEGNDAD